MDAENNLTYSTAIEELQKIVTDMQSENCSIDNLSDYTVRALELLKFCKSKLTATDEKLKKILEELESQQQ